MAETAANVVPTNYAIDSDLLDPRRYGCAFDGVTDDTAALNRWVAVVNASTRPVSTWPTALTTLCGPLDTITAQDLIWNVHSTIKAKGDSWSRIRSRPTNHINIVGSGARIYHLTMNGNQGAFSAQPFGQLLQIGGDDVSMEECSLTDSALRAVEMSGISKGRFANCHFDDNCNLGTQFNTCSDLHFIDCTWSNNGYGFQRTLATNAFAAFGFAIRFRSHDISFVNCKAMQNGRDGMNVNQGSYGVKFKDCVASMNGDGGFTIAADDTTPGMPGNSESPHDLEFIDCEAYNNWSSGLVAYSRVNDVVVDGGRYYNNHRLANQQPTASSYPNGLYFAAGSIGISVRTNAYDDRQLCAITRAVDDIVVATGWAAGVMASHPRVAFYDAGMKFQGYATITDESAGSLTIISNVQKSYYGVTISSIAPGWYVSQRVQHNGLFFDNSCIGTAAVTGSGQLPGAFSYTGFKAISAFTSGGQNILLPTRPLDALELLANPSFDTSIGSGTSWAYRLAGGGKAALYTKADSNVRSRGALQLIGGTSVAEGDSTLISNGLAHVQGSWVEASVWANATDAGDAFLQLFWNPGSGALATTVIHPGGGYQQLKIGAFIPVGTTLLMIRLISAAGKTNYFDDATLRAKSDP